MNTIQKHVRIRTRYDAAENVVIVVVQRGLHLLVVGLVVDVHVEGHPGDVEHGQGVTPSFFCFRKIFICSHPF